MNRSDDTDDDYSGEVIELKGLDQVDWDGPISMRRRNYLGCQHHRIEIDDHLRRVYCRDCKEQLDPIECLMNWRRYWMRIQGVLAHAKKHEEKLARARERAASRRRTGK